MKIQLTWLKELLNKKPSKFEEYFYFDIQNYLGLTFENDKRELYMLNKICGNYANELFICDSKKNVKKWLDNISFYITSNIEVDYLIDNFFDKIKNKS